MDRAGLYPFLTQFRYGVVSSLSASGTPQSALVGIAVTPQLSIVFDTVRSSRKYANLIERKACSFVVGWGGEQTVQLEGVAIEPAVEELKRYQDIYFAVWPDGQARLAWPGIVHLVVQPTWIRYSDFGASPPLILEFEP